MSDDLDASQRFTRCLDAVLRYEGGYANHPADPGGATNFGITRKVLARWRGVSPWWKLNTGQVKALSRTEAASIYKALYWSPIKVASMPAGLDLALFDFGVNSGNSRAAKALQGVLKVKADGQVGPLTLAAIKRQTATATSLSDLIISLCSTRLSFLQRLATFSVFGRGWSRRVGEVRAAALAMAGLPAFSTSQSRTNPMNILSGYKTYIVAAAMLVSGLAQLLGVDIPAFDGHSAGQMLMEALAILFLRQGIKKDISGV